MLDYQEYTIGDNGFQGNGNGHHGNGYDQLDGDFALFYRVGKRFVHKVKRQDNEDFLHDLFVAFMKVKTTYAAKGKELTEGGLVRIAQYEVADYWREQFKRINGTDCGRCNKAQRTKCKAQDLYRECPKAITLDSLDRVIEDGEGNSTPLHEFIADDRATDLVNRTETRLLLQGYPMRFVKLACKKYMGYTLNSKDRVYFNKQVKKTQKTLL